MNRTKFAIAISAALIAALALYACGDYSNNSTYQLNLKPTPSISDALSELDSMQAPLGVNPEVFNQLRLALRSALVARQCQKAVCQPPTGSNNIVRDLAINDNGGGTYSLTWHYCNLGDYNQDGTVGIADITPLAMHYGESWEDGEENSLPAVVDGSRNKEVDIADVTPIAMNFGVEVASYRIEKSTNQLSGYCEITIQAFSSGENSATQRTGFAYNFAAVGGFWYRVVPLDNAGAQGEPSNPIPLSNPVEPPAAPSGLSTTSVSHSQIDLSWEDNSGNETSFRIERKTEADSFWSEIGNVAAESTAYSDAGLLELTTYYYRVRAYNSGGYSDFSEEASATTNEAPLAPPRDFIASDGLHNDRIALQWTHPAIGPTPDGYRIYKALDQSGTYELAATVGYVTQWEDTDVPDVSPYWYKLLSYKGGYPDSDYCTADSGYRIQSWHIVTVDGSGLGAEYTSLTEVNGAPAIAYRSDNKLKYARATTPIGDSWSAPFIVDVEAGSGWFNSLLVVQGRPAIGYRNLTSGLKYVRSLDENGEGWNSPYAVDSATNVGFYSSMAIANGNPAIAYFDMANYDLKFARSADVTGDSWAAPQVVDGGEWTGYYPSLAIVDGFPAISYFVFNDLKFIRAKDTDGDDWESSLLLEGMMNNSRSCMKVVNGYPAVSYYESISGNLCYKRADQINGDSWMPAVTACATDDIGVFHSLAVVNGNPAIASYEKTNGDLRYIRSTDANGAAWGAAETVDSAGDVGEHVSLAAINGLPAISYSDKTNLSLKFAVYY